VLHHANSPIEHIYFVESGLVSVMANVGSGLFMEVWLVGSDGVAGVPAILGEVSSAHKRMVHVGGSALRMRTRDLHRLMDDLPAFREVLLKYTYVVLFQTSQGGACNAKHPVEQRLARWLLMAGDRCESAKLPLTQQVLARMLGVRRATVTHCLNALERAGVLRKSRGSLTIVDRDKLVDRTCYCYRSIQSKYDRLLGAQRVASESPYPAFALPMHVAPLDGIACRSFDP
jgi:CRP-like cAMP-binding protein